MRIKKKMRELHLGHVQRYPLSKVFNILSAHGFEIYKPMKLCWAKPFPQRVSKCINNIAPTRSEFPWTAQGLAVKRSLQY